MKYQKNLINLRIIPENDKIRKRLAKFALMTTLTFILIQSLTSLDTNAFSQQEPEMGTSELQNQTALPTAGQQAEMNHSGSGVAPFGDLSETWTLQEQMVLDQVPEMGTSELQNQTLLQPTGQETNVDHSEQRESLENTTKMRAPEVGVSELQNRT